MYLSYFGFNEQPFALTPNTTLYYGLAPHYEALQMIISALQMGEGVIKVTGEVGTGKTMICRILINHLQNYVTLIYLPNPILSGNELKLAVAKELRIHNANTDITSIVNNIQTKLIESHRQGRRVVAVVDEAQALSDEALEELRLFGNLETGDRKLLQLVLLGQPELDLRLEQHNLRQFRQRITFSAQLRPLSMEETVAYIEHRIKTAGCLEELFDLKQKKSIWYATKGIPRLINQVCHKSLLLAFSHQKNKVSNHHLFDALHDTFDARKPKFKIPYLWGWSEQ